MTLHLKPQPTPTRFLVGEVFLCNGAAYEVRGVHLGAVGQTSTIALNPLSETPNCSSGKEMHVPEHILEAAFRAGAAFGAVFLDDLISEAVRRYGGENEVFTTATLQSSLGEDYTGQEIAQLLALHKGVVRLLGGSHWLRLPAGLCRYEES